MTIYATSSQIQLAQENDQNKCQLQSSARHSQSLPGPFHSSKMKKENSTCLLYEKERAASKKKKKPRKNKAKST